MIVFVVLKSDSYDRVELLAVRYKKEDAMKYAEEQEPDRTFDWIHDNEDNAHVHSFRLGVDPIYNYFVERQDVQ